MKPGSEGQTVLVIDDEEVVRLLFQTLLEDEGLAVLVAENGTQGTRLLAEKHPAVALVDKNLPDMSGLDLIANQKKLHPNTEFIMITGYASLDSAVKAMEVGAFSYLTKPFDDMEIVLDRIRAALEVNNLRQETSQLRDRLSNIGTASAKSTVSHSDSLPGALLDQLETTIRFLDSFLPRREQVPTAATWARVVDMVEQELENIIKVLAPYRKE